MTSPWTAVFLGIIAIGSLVQVALLVTAAWGGLRLARTFARVRDDVRRELRQPLRNLSETRDNLRDAGSAVAQEVRTLRESVRTVSFDARTTTAEYRRLAARVGA